MRSDGVNVAARLEAMAEPGSVLITHSVHEHVDQAINSVHFPSFVGRWLQPKRAPIFATKPDRCFSNLRPPAICPLQ